MNAFIINLGNKTTLFIWTIAFHVLFFLLLPLKLLFFNNRGYADKNIAIEAGSVGWKKIDIKETYQSAIEFYGKDKVKKIVIKNKNYYIFEVIKNIRDKKITHYFYDPRSSDMENSTSLIKAIILVPIFLYYKVTPIAILPDFAYRKWRYQCAFLTIFSGLVITVLHKHHTSKYFPHSRIMGPQMMPFSSKTINEISTFIKEKKENKDIVINFTGSLYEPRKSKLEIIKKNLDEEGITLNINAREFGGEMIDDESYWKNMVFADIVITTADQYEGTNIDNLGEHLIYRYTEALACRTLLVAPIIYGANKFFKNKDHYYGYKDIKDAVKIIKDLHVKRDKISAVSKNGHKRVQELVNSGTYWMQIETLLGKNSILK